MEYVNTRTGTIYVDKERKLEFLCVGDYGKEANIKADFLGLTKEIIGVKHKEVDISKKCVATISTQKGCPMNCRFCDCPKFGYYGNASIEDLSFQIENIISRLPTRDIERFNVHFARMGEPTFNESVLSFTEIDLYEIVDKYLNVKVLHPVISTMMPKDNKNLESFLKKWCEIKNVSYGGEAGLQLSINSTDEDQRKWQFDNKSLSLLEISEISKKLPMPIGRKYTLNFAVTKDTIIDVNKLSILFDKERFIVKLTPIHETKEAVINKFDISGYNDYDVYRDFEKPLVENGWDVIVFVPSKEEDEDRITCGNALISSQFTK